MPPQEQADLWMALRDRMKANWAELTLQEKKAGLCPLFFLDPSLLFLFLYGFGLAFCLKNLVCWGVGEMGDGFGTLGSWGGCIGAALNIRYAMCNV
jgi:hypothetical protein